MLFINSILYIYKDEFFIGVKKILTIYISITFLEWFIHNKMMHGDPEKLIKIPIVGKYLSNTAEEHLSHHKDVNMNM